MENNNIVEQLLTIDSVGDFEKQIGKKREEWTETDQLEFLKYAVVNNQIKGNYLKEMGDTHFGMTWEEFLTLCRKQGFEVAYRNDFVDDLYDEINTEEEIVLFHKEKGLILYANSYRCKTSVGSAKLYGEIRMKEDSNSHVAYQVLSACSFEGTGLGTILVSLDLREGMIANLSKLEGSYNFVNPWNKMPFIWFLNYVEEARISQSIFDMSYEKINQEKIALMSSEAQQIMGNSSSHKVVK